MSKRRALDLTYTPGPLRPFGQGSTYFARLAKLPVELFEYIMRLMNRQLRIEYMYAERLDPRFPPPTYRPKGRYVTARGYLHPLGRIPPA